MVQASGIWLSLDAIEPFTCSSIYSTWPKGWVELGLRVHGVELRIHTNAWRYIPENASVIVYRYTY